MALIATPKTQATTKIAMSLAIPSRNEALQTRIIMLLAIPSTNQGGEAGQQADKGQVYPNRVQESRT